MNRIGERNENIYLGYSIREIDTQHLIYPHGGFVVEGEYTIGEECGPSPKPIYINTTGGTISPETVLKGYVGFSNGEKVVGSLDLSAVKAQAKAEGFAEGHAVGYAEGLAACTNR